MLRKCLELIVSDDNLHTKVKRKRIKLHPINSKRKNQYWHKMFSLDVASACFHLQLARLPLEEKLFKENLILFEVKLNQK